MEIKSIIKQKFTSLICPCTIFLSISLIFSGYGFCSEKTFDKVEKYVNKSIDLRQKNQKKFDKWEHKKTQLIAEYERLKQEEEFLDQKNKELINEKLKHENRLSSLVLQKNENIKIQKDMLPFLQNVVNEVSLLVSEGLPFLQKERKKRIVNLEKTVNDPYIKIAEKYRKTMETLFIEAGYGNTTEIVREKIIINGNEVIEDVFRLGRIAMFALSLDHKSGAYFNIVENRWVVLNKKYIRPVYSAMEISRKRKTAELVSLPIGRLENNQ